MYIVDIKRTPIGKFLGSLSNLSAPELTKPLFSYFLNQYPFLKKNTDEVIIGNVLSGGIGMNPARIAAHISGIHYSVPAYTVNHVCASGMNAIIQGARSILSGDAHLILSGGMESMSQAPFILKDTRQGMRTGPYTLIDSLTQDGLFCSLSQKLMGVTAENVAKIYEIPRNEQDVFALESHKKALHAQKNKAFNSEIIPITKLSYDESPRDDTSLRKLDSLLPVFKKTGTVTAGNSSTLGDGAALALLASEKAIKKYNLQPKAKIIDSIFVGVKPSIMGMGAGLAIEKLLKKNSLTVADIDIFEINEAFAAQTCAVINKLRISSDKLNLHGGAIALGHPLAMSGTRIIGSLINSLQKTQKEFGVASICIGGGQGAAVLIKNI